VDAVVGACVVVVAVEVLSTTVGAAVSTTGAFVEVVEVEVDDSVRTGTLVVIVVLSSFIVEVLISTEGVTVRTGRTPPQAGTKSLMLHVSTSRS